MEAVPLMRSSIGEEVSYVSSVSLSNILLSLFLLRRAGILHRYSVAASQDHAAT